MGSLFASVKCVSKFWRFVVSSPSVSPFLVGSTSGDGIGLHFFEIFAILVKGGMVELWG